MIVVSEQAATLRRPSAKGTAALPHAEPSATVVRQPLNGALNVPPHVPVLRVWVGAVQRCYELSV